MRRIRGLLLSLPLLAAFALPAHVALAGNPHFVEASCSVSGATVTCTGKEAGLGDEAQVHVVVSADAQCVNPGNNKPRAANKRTFTAEGDFPVQNGKAEFRLTLTPTFQPDCSPPMTVEISNLSVTDETHGITANL